MLKQDVINHFGRQRLIADTLRISQAAVSRWGDIIPEKQALRLEYLTQGALVYDPTLYKKVLHPEPAVNV
ncbi:Cro/Cl family transcriptional regulator [Grimontia kaedaensis]|uniref:Cro/Cl family transcriptional regulator n=1 Tax=Grimontia kaedaensis TaxID=2872157 RepID=A0ABY4WNH2_9GAMM|nr:Cro/CI family transcriptional regulator [Grimontia kaedaensis]USH01106.1 Cro/Cl family transcriptional regulator [Grimontia kaedaensis]